MASDFFRNTFGNVPIPVIVCKSDESNAIVYFNTSARILLDPHYEGRGKPLVDLLQLVHPSHLDTFRQLLLNAGSVEGWKTKVTNANGLEIGVSLVANYVEFDRQGYFVLYVYEERLGESISPYLCNNLMSLAFNAANHANDTDSAFHRVLALVGEGLQVSRTYVLETDGERLRNTYEWCAEGIASVQGEMQQFTAHHIFMDHARFSGIYITEDTSNLPKQERRMLERQDVRSLAVLPLYLSGRIQGYIGLDDCLQKRRWSGAEIQLLRNLSNLVAGLLARRNAERRSRHGITILQTIMDNIDHAIYVNTTDTYKLVFINKTMADALGCDVKEILGKPCWDVVYGYDKPCDFCPMEKMQGQESFVWDKLQTNGRWYSMKDTLIQWMDGQEVHIATCLDITERHNYEEQLQYFASVDSMTGTFNREWGYKLIRDLMAEVRAFPQPASLVFIDLDGLKQTNDTFGHDAGDDMIVSIIEAVRSKVRKSDSICRWGGDEFILLLRCGGDMAHILMNKIAMELEQINSRGERPYALSFSYGIKSLNENPDESVDYVISQADQLMYAQKMGKRQSAIGN